MPNLATSHLVQGRSLLVCHCRVVSDRTIRAAIAGGAADVDAVTEACGAGGGCGGCAPSIERLLAEADCAVRDPVLLLTRQAARRALGPAPAPVPLSA